MQRGAGTQYYKTGATTPSQTSPVHQGNGNIVLALRTLGSFDFEGTGEDNCKHSLVYIWTLCI